MRIKLVCPNKLHLPSTGAAFGLALALQVTCLASSEARAAPAGSLKGEKLFNAIGCYTCHGRVGQGSIASGPPLNPMKLPEAAFFSSVRRPAGLMPPYRTISDGDLGAIFAYLKSLPPGAQADQIPLLDSFIKKQGVGSGP